MINYNWTVTGLWTKPVADKQDYVVVAAYEVSGVDGEYSAFIPDAIQFSTESVGEFIAYSDLTEEIVISWIKQTLGPDAVASVEACVEGQINDQKNPPVTASNSPLPWS